MRTLAKYKYSIERPSQGVCISRYSLVAFRDYVDYKLPGPRDRDLAEGRIEGRLHQGATNLDNLIRMRIMFVAARTARFLPSD